MDTSDFVLRFLVSERLEWARAQARQRALVPARPPLRLRLGALLVALGHRLLRSAPAPQQATP
jgi:hypothetical protein